MVIEHEQDQSVNAVVKVVFEGKYIRLVMRFARITNVNIAFYKNKRKFRSTSLTEVKECNEFAEVNIVET